MPDETYYAKHKEASIRYSREYYRRNREKVCEATRDRYWDDPDKQRARKRADYDPDEQRARRAKAKKINKTKTVKPHGFNFEEAIKNAKVPAKPKRKK